MERRAWLPASVNPKCSLSTIYCTRSLSFYILPFEGVIRLFYPLLWLYIPIFCVEGLHSNDRALTSLSLVVLRISRDTCLLQGAVFSLQFLHDVERYSGVIYHPFQLNAGLPRTSLLCSGGHAYDFHDGIYNSPVTFWHPLFPGVQLQSTHVYSSSRHLLVSWLPNDGLCTGESIVADSCYIGEGKGE